MSNLQFFRLTVRLTGFIKDGEQNPSICGLRRRSGGNVKAGTLTGDLAFHGVTRPVELKVVQIGAGCDLRGIVIDRPT